MNSHFIEPSLPYFAHSNDCALLLKIASGKFCWLFGASSFSLHIELNELLKYETGTLATTPNLLAPFHPFF